MKRKHRTGIKIVAALAVLSGSGLLAAILFLCRGEWLPGLLLFAQPQSPAQAADLVDLSAAAHFETHCRDRDPSRSHAGRNPCGSF